MIDEENDTGGGKDVAMFHIMLYDKDGETGKKINNICEWLII